MGSTGYTEIDTTECYLGGCGFHVFDPGNGLGGGCDANYPRWDTNWHTFKTVWNASGITQYEDSNQISSCPRNLTNPMFLIMQIQTGGPGGTPENALLPQNLSVDYVKITQP